MFDLGDELIIENYRIPWLIWIQLVVLFLLIIILFYFSISTSDLSENTTTATATATASHQSRGSLVISTKSHNNNPARLNTTSSSHKSKVRENQSKGGETGTSTSRRRVKSGEDSQESDQGTSTKDVTHFSSFEHSYHPCHYLGLAKQAVLKCLGLDFLFESSSNKEAGKEH
ncbi:unnamed protein product [Ilex paraguariensis]|uniref:Transmembrane protein n=1 Tax=Ilex paraguariensis TaxID=185542 RepID=A0ABC8RRN0_9AQUA